MDMLFETARTGNVVELQRILRENPLILNYVALESHESPLHVACLCGHLAFAREILMLKPEFAKKLNPKGYSPLQMAAANGHVEIVKELIRFDKELCHLKGIDMITPLHSAIIAGEIGVINEILSVCPTSIEDVTIQGETCLHLAVQNRQYESLQILVGWIRKMGKDEISEVRDARYNTAWSLAMQMKERRALQLLMSTGTGNGTSELVFRTTADTQDRSHGPECMASSYEHLANTNYYDYFKFQKGRDSPDEARTALLVIAVLVATATYQVGLSPPGGTWQDNNSMKTNNSSDSDQTRIAGTSIIGTYDDVGFIIMIGLNSIGFFLSVYMIGMLTSRFPLRGELIICITALSVTYSIAVTNITPEKVRVISVIFTSVLPTLVPVIIHLMRNYLGPMMRPVGRNLMKYKVVKVLADLYE